MTKTKKIALLGIMTGLALITYVLESLLPSIYLPGAKIGLSNIFTMIAVIVLGLPAGLILTVARTTLGALIVGNLFSLTYSCSAGVASTVIIFLLYRFFKGKISIIAISVASAVTHNLVQNLVFCIIGKTLRSFALMPYLGIFGIISGLIVGIIVLLILKTVPVTFWLSQGKGGNIENTQG